ncbi:MAG: hypothetical protein L6428_03560 [Candidatus Aminicenantes bacterium]|nr:hypothetical protein [Candidatus Aminicenantes bacterium]
MTVDLSRYFCTNKQCKDYGICGKGNLHAGFSYGKHNRHMLSCGTCKARFSETKCTAFFCSRYSNDQIGKILRTTSEGVGVRATARILELDKDAVNRVILKAGEHCIQVLDNLLVNLSLTEVQLDELWTFLEKKVLPVMRVRMAPNGSGQPLTRRPASS